MITTNLTEKIKRKSDSVDVVSTANDQSNNAVEAAQSQFKDTQDS